jgi:hypothetical protein
VDIAFGALSFFLFFLLLYGEQYFDIHHLIKVAGDAIQFARDIRAQSGRDLKVVTTDCQIHKKPPAAWVEKSTPKGGRETQKPNVLNPLCARAGIKARPPEVNPEHRWE